MGVILRVSEGVRKRGVLHSGKAEMITYFISKEDGDEFYCTLNGSPLYRVNVYRKSLVQDRKGFTDCV